MNRLLLIGVVALAACSSKSGSPREDAQVLMQESRDEQGLQRMQVSKSETDIQFKGKEYHVQIVRTPDESLPTVVSERGDKFLDNKITLQLSRGSAEVVNVTLTKNYFASLIETDFLNRSILEGVVYDKTTPQGIVFAASVCYPQTDLYFPLSLTITADGKISINKVELLEENPEVESNE